MKDWVLVSLFLVATSSCIHRYGLQDSYYRNRRVSYYIGNLEDTWQKVSIRNADVAFLNKEGNATLLYNSQCLGQSDASLDALMGHLFMGMTEVQVISSQKIALDEREAMLQTTSAKLDGVPRFFRSLVLKKDNCVFDVVLSSSPNAFNKYEPLMAQIQKDFHTEVRK